MNNSSYEIFFRLSSDLMVVADTDGYFKKINPAFANALGYTEAELLAEPYNSFMHSSDVARTESEVRQLVDGSATFHFENRYRCKDGTYKLLSWISPAPNPADRLLYGIARDITEERARTRRDQSNP